MRQIDSRMTPINDDYPTCERTLATLRIYGDDLDPQSITRRLGLQPSDSQRRGEIKAGIRGRQRTVKVGGWFLSSEDHVQSKDLRRHLDWLLDRLLPAKEEILELQEEDAIKMGVNCIWWSESGQGGPTLWPEQMQCLAGLNLECGFDVAFFGEDEEDPGIEGFPVIA